MSHPATMPAHRNGLARIVRAACTMPPHTARLVLGMALGHPAIVCGARVPRQRTLAARHWNRREPRIAAMQAAIAKVSRRWQRELLLQLKEVDAKEGAPIQAGLGVAIDVVFDLARFAGDLIAAVRDESLATLADAGRQFFREIGRRDDAWSMPPQKAMQFFATRENLIKDTAAEVHRTIMDDLADGVAKGESRAKLARRITSQFDDFAETRANTIASTETAAGYGVARQEAQEQSGVRYKRWLTSNLPNVRAWHEDAENDPRNQRVPVGEPFIVKNGKGTEERLMFPGDPAGSADNVINCHCVSIAVGEDEP